MLLEELTEEEVELAGLIHDPVVMAECLFPYKCNNLESLKNYKEDEFFKVRMYELPMLSYEYLLAENDELSDVENFELKKGAGSIFMYCGRKIGKTLIGILIDLLLDAIHNIFDWVTVFSSFDEMHITPVLDPLFNILHNHPFFELFNYKQRKHPTYQIKTEDFTHLIEGINMNINKSKEKQGSSFERVRANKMVIDEHQYETNAVEAKRSQSSSEKGWIERYAGITSFKEDSPAGRIFNNLSKRNQLINLPQYISFFWNDALKASNITDYNGEDTLDYRIHIKAEVCKDADSVYDMERIETEAYLEKKAIKHIEISKKDFWRFKNKIIVDKHKSAFRTWIASDFGERKAEIIIVFEIDTQPYSTFYYTYNITMYDLIPDEQVQVFEYLIEELNPNFVGIDCTDGGGRNVFRELIKKYPKRKDVFQWVHFAEKMPVKVKTELNAEGERVPVTDKKGNKVMEEEFVSHWSVEQNKKLLYGSCRLKIPTDPKFDRQFRGIFSAKIGNNVSYGKSSEDHLHQSFQVLSIMIFRNEKVLNQPIESTKPVIGITKSIKL